MSGNSRNTVRTYCDEIIVLSGRIFVKIVSGSRKSLHLQYQRLRLWSGNIGVYARSPASADERLAGDEDLLYVVLDSLKTLRRILVRVLRNRYEAPEFASTSSDDSDSSTTASEFELSDDSYIGKLIGKVDNITDNLFSALTIIRRHVNSTVLKPIRTIDLDAKLGPDHRILIAEFEQYVEFFLQRNYSTHTSIAKEWESKTGEAKEWKAEGWDSTSLTPWLGARLINTAVIRRKSLIYQQRHTRKLYNDTAAKFDQVNNIEIKSRLRPDLPEKLPSTDPVDTTRQVQQSNEEPMERLSATLPTIYEQPRVRKSSDVRDQSAPKTSKSIIQQRAGLDIPPHPKLLPEHDEMVCYICGRFLDSAFATDEAWRKHVLDDVAPFVCLFENCASPHVLYRSPDEWYRHMQDHRMKWCCTSSTHATLFFDSRPELETHYDTTHSTSFSVSQRKLLVNEGRRPLDSLFESCPLCGWEIDENAELVGGLSAVPKEISEISKRGMQRHIESHLYELALLCMAPLQGVVGSSDSADEDRTSNARSGKQLFEKKIQRLDLPADNDYRKYSPAAFETIPLGTKPQLVSVEWPDELDDATTRQWNSTCEHVSMMKMFFAGSKRSFDFADTQGRRFFDVEALLQFKSYSIEQDNSILRSIGKKQAYIQTKAQSTLRGLINDNFISYAEINTALRNMTDPFTVEVRDSKIGSPRTIEIVYDNETLARSAHDTLEEYIIDDLFEGDHLKWLNIYPPAHEKRRNAVDYTVAWICSSEQEYKALCAMLDDTHKLFTSTESSDNSLVITVGSVGHHDIVCVQMCDTPSLARRREFLHVFSSLRHIISVGAGYGAPKIDSLDIRDIRLGDIVVCQPEVAGLELYRIQDNSFVQRQKYSAVVIRSDAVSLPPRQQSHPTVNVSKIVEQTIGNHEEIRRYAYPADERDDLFASTYEHVSPTVSCQSCDKSKLVERPERPDTEPYVHGGRVGMSQTALTLNVLATIAADHDLACIDSSNHLFLEAGICLVVRGVCSYADTHNVDDSWSLYAAVTAAAYCKALILSILPFDIFQNPYVKDYIPNLLEETDSRKLAPNPSDTRYYPKQRQNYTHICRMCRERFESFDDYDNHPCRW